MKLITVGSYEELSQKAAEAILAEVKAKPKCVLGLATGSTPTGAYDILKKACAGGEASFANVRTVNLDEYIGLPGDSMQSYRYYMNEKLFSGINIDIRNTNVPNGTAQDVEAECERYESLIESMGGIDLQLLGIGNNGHIGFNEPDTVFRVRTHVVKLAKSTVEANMRFFERAGDVPTHAVTMGMGAIMKARKVLLIASGESKRPALERAMYGEADPQVPASILRLHADVTVICDFKV